RSLRCRSSTSRGATGALAATAPRSWLPVLIAEVLEKVLTRRARITAGGCLRVLTDRVQVVLGGLHVAGQRSDLPFKGSRTCRRAAACGRGVSAARPSARPLPSAVRSRRPG